MTLEKTNNFIVDLEMNPVTVKYCLKFDLKLIARRKNCILVDGAPLQMEGSVEGYTAVSDKSWTSWCSTNACWEWTSESALPSKKLSM